MRNIIKIMIAIGLMIFSVSPFSVFAENKEARSKLITINDLIEKMPKVVDQEKIINGIESGTIAIIDEVAPKVIRKTNVPRIRGNCTDVYSKQWCDTHGYENNRPVGSSVKLTQKELSCLEAGLGTTFGLVTFFSGSPAAIFAYTGTALVSFALACGSM